MSLGGAPLKIAMAGAGRMGQAIIERIDARPGVSLASVWQRDAGPAAARQRRYDGAITSADVNVVVAAADVIIDFSLPLGTEQVVEASRDHGKPLVCGVSGLSQAQLGQLDDAAATIPIVYDRNMSQGIAVLDALVGKAVAALGADYHVEIHEVHHVHKQDAPSGTALKLGESAAAARGRRLEDIGWYKPDARTAEPAPGDIRFEVERRGEVPGEHTVVLSSPTERLEFRHSVTTRGVFAEGALRAAEWLASKPSGRYDMRDVLGLRDRT